MIGRLLGRERSTLRSAWFHGPEPHVRLAMIVLLAAGLGGCRRTGPSMDDSSQHRPSQNASSPEQGTPATDGASPAPDGKTPGSPPSPSGSAGETSEGKATTPPQSPHGSTGGTPTLEGVLILYARSGGFAGMQDRLTVHESGQVSLVRRDQVREYRLDPGKLEALKRAFESSDFSSLRESYPAKGADLFTYEITYRGRKVTAMDSAVPATLDPLIRILNDVIDTSGVSMR